MKQATTLGKIPESKANTEILLHNETTTHKQYQKPPTQYKSESLGTWRGAST